jgi:hypothetical protein
LLSANGAESNRFRNHGGIRLEVNMGARQKLNRAFLNGSLLLASLAGVLTGSWMVFATALVLLLIASVVAGEIRLRNRK